ncbi:hypothetical protein [Rhodanobacter soli]|jgi:hypothetical protein|uniref:Uncharacterized protein n=1 Tax=Rhodanobacter soli TaxID=590609 RepID=A0ABV2PZT3_9GAMM
METHDVAYRPDSCWIALDMASFGMRLRVEYGGRFIALAVFI